MTRRPTRRPRRRSRTRPRATITTRTSRAGHRDPGLSAIPDFTLPDISLPPDVSLPDLSELEDQFRDTLEQTGLDDDQIDCLLEQLDLGSGEVPDLSEMTDLFEECDISLSDIGG